MQTNVPLALDPELHTINGHIVTLLQFGQPFRGAFLAFRTLRAVQALVVGYVLLAAREECRPAQCRVFQCNNVEAVLPSRVEAGRFRERLTLGWNLLDLLDKLPTGRASWRRHRWFM